MDIMDVRTYKDGKNDKMDIMDERKKERKI